MTQEILIALQITAVGMGLVFGAILLLWALMAGLVRLAPERTGEAQGAAPEAGEMEAVSTEAAAEIDEAGLRLRAAAAAVALAMAEQQNAVQEFPLPPTAIISAWQITSRTKTLNRRGATR
jgi:Na+-transporting methylmalonyl-CoA/oxaloacetate decarboxylase gamma subunit